jgi:hypothetical protein
MKLKQLKKKFIVLRNFPKIEREKTSLTITEESAMKKFTRIGCSSQLATIS